MDGTGSFCCLPVLFKRFSSVLKSRIIEDANCKNFCVD